MIGFGKLRHRLAMVPSYMVLAICLVITSAATFVVYRFTERESFERFDNMGLQVENQLKNRMDRYLNSLDQLRAHLMTAGHVDRFSFEKYVSNLMLLERYPGIRGLGYTARVLERDLQEHVRKIREREQLPNYEVWPAGPRSEYTAIVYLQPLDARNLRALGFDMSVEATRREAMERARDTGWHALSGMVDLVQQVPSEAPRAGFLLYVPMYSQDPSTLVTVAQRRQALVGFVYSPFRAKDLFEAIFKADLKTHRQIRVKIYDGPSASDATNLMFDNDSLFNTVMQTNGKWRKVRILEVAGRQWTLELESRPQFFVISANYAAVVIGLTGLCLSLLLFWLVFSARRYALRESQSKETLKIINQVGRNIATELDLHKLVQGITDAGTQLTKAEFGAFFYNMTDAKGESYMLYALSGANHEAFANFPMPRNTDVFAPTFSGASVVLSDDITQDPRYGNNAPYHGMPEGHLPVRSYLAVPVVSRSGEVIGGLFFGHQKPGVFGLKQQHIITGIASHAAVAIDNARLYQYSQDAIRARDEFLSICSHELKTPITSLKLQMQLTSRVVAKSEGSDGKYMVDMCAKMDLQLNQLIRLVDDMLDITRIERGKLSIIKQEVDLSQLASMVVERFSVQAHSMNVELSLLTAGTIIVNGDFDRLIQVITNLLSNALKYGSGKPVDINTWIEGDRAKLSVRDQGHGIAEKDLKRIFGRFERLSSYRNVGGLGLGLFIGQQIAEAHQGVIQVTSQVGKGSEFILDLPLGRKG